jgi:hypothetical protein|tara:strand:- start:3 stop:527 length:525 start_codon:yes stop_codon:yes gene_type:complete
MFGLFKSKEVKQSYLEQVQSEMDNIVDNGKVALDDLPPFRMKKGEHYIFSVDANLGTYKNNGNFKYGALTGRIKIAKGISLRGGAGKMGMEKSWVFDQPGVLHVTTDRIVFNGINKNSSVNFTKVIDMTIDEDNNALFIDRESGSDWAFKMSDIPETNKMATAFLFQRGQISLK